MTSVENKATVRHYLEEVWNQRNPAIIDNVIAPDVIQHVRDVLPGREGIHKFFAMIYEAFPDVHFTVEDMIAEADRVSLRFTVRGTHKGSFRGIPPTNKPITLTGIQIVRISDGKIIESWNETDNLGMLQQLGVIPTADVK